MTTLAWPQRLRASVDTRRALEGAAVALTLVNVWLTARAEVVAWPVGVVASALYLVVFQRARLYSDVLLQLYFIATGFYGWYTWSASAAELEIRRLSWGARVDLLIVVTAGSLVLGAFMKRRTRAALPYRDAVIAVSSVVAQVLLALAYWESWALWVMVDVLAVWTYLQRRLYPTTLLYLALLALAADGLCSWVLRS